MKPKHLLLLFCCISGLFANAQRPFVTVWKTNNPGISASNQIIFQGTGANYSIRWINLDDASDTGNATASGTDTITFAAEGVYQIYVTPGKGTFTAIKGFNYLPDSGIYGDGKKLISVEQWGDIHWTTFDSAFSNCFQLVINATDVPDLSQVGDMSYAFLRCISLKDNPAMDNWDVSNVTNMHGMFSSALLFNQPIGNWNVSNVTDMNGMFEAAQAFNQPIGNWDVSNITDMAEMFRQATKFNQPIGNWNVSNVTSMIRMFNAASAFNKPIGNWKVSNVTNMGEMFREATKFNQPIGNWNVTNLRIAGAMFNDASAFNQSIGNWDVSNVTDMEDMFRGAVAFNQPINSWNVSNVTATDRMFMDAAAFDQPLGNWNVSNAGTMNGMFMGANKFNQPLGNWNVGNVVGMAEMFQDAYTFNQPINTWDVSNVISMQSMFQNAKVFNQPLGNWNVSSVNNMSNMFDSATVFNQPINNWNVSIVEDMSNMFVDAHSFNQPLGSWNLVNAKALNNMLNNSGMNCDNYSLTLRGWANNKSTARYIILGATNLSYDSAFAQAAHDSLINITHWTIIGDAADHCSIILPVTFLFFSVNGLDNAALLNWSVANETGIKGYYVEKSTNGFNFNSIAFVAGNSAVKQTYTYTDNGIFNGTIYYRIKEVDNDGKYIYSSIQKIEFSNFAWKIHSNPVDNSFIELMLDKPANISITILSSNGNVVKTIQKGNLSFGNYNIPLDINNVSTGFYIVKLMVNDKAYTSAVIKQ